MANPESPNRGRTESFEVRFGSWWLPRIGIVVLLTALVFLARYFYQPSSHVLSAFGKVALMYVAGGGVLALGWWLARGKEALQTYARILIAGGLAAIYFTTFAAYYFAGLRVIANPFVAAVLLLACTGFVLWFADREKSQPLAAFAVGLAYYATLVVLPASRFTLLSHLFLAIAAVLFLVRRGWVVVAFLILVATYLSFAYQQFIHDGRVDLEVYPTPHQFWPRYSFFIAYWLVFTAAVFWKSREDFSGRARLTFLTLNNLLFFALFAITVPNVYSGSFWFFSGSFGIVLLGLAWLARRRHAEEPELAGAYRGQGIVFVALGAASYFSGARRSLALAIGSAGCLLASRSGLGLAMRLVAYVLAAFAAIYAWEPVTGPAETGLIAAALSGAVVIFNACFVQTRAGRVPTDHPRADDSPLSWEVGYFSAIGLFLWLIVTFAVVDSGIHRPPVLALEALLLTASVYIIGVREIAVLAKAYLEIALFLWLTQIGTYPGPAVTWESWFRHFGSYSGPWWNPAIVVLATFALSRWWNPARNKILPANQLVVLQAIYAAAIMAILFFWLYPRFSVLTANTVTLPASWLVTASLLAVLTLSYGLAKGERFVALFGQVFSIHAIAVFCLQLQERTALLSAALMLVPILAFLAIPRILAFYPDATRAFSTKTIVWISNAFHAIAAVLFIAWIVRLVPRENQFIVLELVGFSLLLLTVVHPGALIGSLVISSAAVIACWANQTGAEGFRLLHLVAFALLLIQQQLSKRLPPEDKRPPQAIQNAGIVIGIGSLWYWVYLWVEYHFCQGSGGSYHCVALTASWSILGVVVFAIGLFFCETMYRLLGFLILLAALARAVLVDAGRIETLARSTSFFVLGAALLVTGFLCIWFRDRIRES